MVDVAYYPIALSVMKCILCCPADMVPLVAIGQNDWESLYREALNHERLSDAKLASAGFLNLLVGGHPVMVDPTLLDGQVKIIGRAKLSSAEAANGLENPNMTKVFG